MTIPGFFGMFVMIFLEMYPPSGRSSVPLGRLSPIGGVCGRYNASTILETWIMGLVLGRGRKDVCAIMPPDLDKLRPYVDRFDLTEAQKVELIHTMWGMMESFVDRAFGLDSAQLCGPFEPSDDSLAHADGIESKAYGLRCDFEKLAGPDRREKAIDDEGDR